MTTQDGKTIVSVHIVGVGFNVEVSKELAEGGTLTLGEALGLAGQTVSADVIYRTRAEIVTPEMSLEDKATVLVARSESNGG